MAYKPWYERIVEIDSAEEREEFLRGVFGGGLHKQKSNVGPALASLLAGFAIGFSGTARKK